MHQKGFSIQMNEQHGVAPRTYVIVPREKRMDFELPAPNRIDVFGDAATRRLRDLVVNGKISSATEDGAVSRKRRAVLDNLFKKNGQFTNRKQRHSQRNSGNSSGSRRICMRQNANNPRVSAAERDIMPAHLLALPMRHPDVYETADVSTGMTFIRECIFSFPQRQIPQLIRPITEIVSEIAYNRQ